MSISNRKDYMKSLKEISIPNLKFYRKSLYLIEEFIPNRNVYTKCLYLIEKSIRKVYI